MQKPTHPLGAALAILALALLAVAVSGCGFGPASDEQKVSKTTATYLNALADGDTRTACTQLTPRAKGEQCEAELKRNRSRLETDALTRAANASIDIEVNDKRATVGLAEPEGARFLLARIGSEWRLDSGYTLRPVAAQIPATPVGKQVAWALGQLNNGAAGLSEGDVTAHFSAQFLTVVMPASEIVATLARTGAGRRPFTFTGFAYPPSATQAVALVKTKTGERGSIRIEVERETPARIIRFEVTDAPPAIEAEGRYSGRFDIGGRKLFLHCTGSGRPTVVFQGGLTTDWVEVQDQVARFTHACSYDPANAPWGRSDRAPTPRTAEEVVSDLHALLAAAKVPGPHVIVGHSNGGLFAQLYASEHRDDVAGLVLLDAVHMNYYARRIALLKKLLPHAEWTATVRALLAHVPAIVDPEQIDVETSLAQTRAALATAPLRPMPLFVLTHGRPENPGSDPRLLAADERLWRTLQAEIAALVPESKHLVAEQSGHDIHHQQPKLVITGIRDVVDAARDPANWKTR